MMLRACGLRSFIARFTTISVCFDSKKIFLALCKCVSFSQSFLQHYVSAWLSPSFRILFASHIHTRFYLCCLFLPPCNDFPFSSTTQGIKATFPIFVRLVCVRRARVYYFIIYWNIIKFIHASDSRFRFAKRIRVLKALHILDCIPNSFVCSLFSCHTFFCCFRRCCC